MGEDELESNCRKSTDRTYNAGEFKCSNNQCIPNAGYVMVYWIARMMKIAVVSSETYTYKEREHFECA